jgi:hypothetical protein
MNLEILTTVDGQSRTFTTAIGVLPDAGDPIDAEGAANVLYAATFGPDGPWSTANYNTSWHGLGVKVTAIVDGEPIIGQHLTTTTGTSSEDIAPPNCTLLVKKNTSAGGRKNRGRMYVGPGLLQNDALSDAGFILTTFQIAYQAMFDAWFSDIDGAGFTPVLFHSGPETPTEIIGFSVESQIATQRRRLR